jgi:hypothetical protein
VPQRKTISRALRQRVAERFKHRCAYCRSSQQIGVAMVVDHAVPHHAGGTTTIENLALACYRCNEFKGRRVNARDPQTGENVPLFNPCEQEWSKHFAWNENGELILARTAVGRATIDALRLNNDWLVSARKIWMRVGLHPPLEN